MEKIFNLDIESNKISCVSCSPNEKSIIIGLNNGAIKILNLDDGKISNMLDKHLNKVTSLAYSSNGSLVASSSFDNSVRIWDTTTLQLIKMIQKESDSCIQSVLYSPNEDYLAFGDININLLKINKNEIYVNQEDEYLGAIFSMSFSPDGKYIVSANHSLSYTAIIWDIYEEKYLTTLEGHLNWIMCVEYSPDGNFIVSGSDDKRACIWDAKTGIMISEFEHDNPVNYVSYSSDGTLIIAGCYNDTVCIWNILTCTCLTTFRGPSWGGHIYLSPKKRTIIRAQNNEIFINKRELNWLARKDFAMFFNNLKNIKNLKISVSKDKVFGILDIVRIICSYL